MKKSIKRDVLIYAISFGVILLLNMLRTNKNILSETSQIFYFIGTEMYLLSIEKPFFLLLSIILLIATVALPIIYFIYDAKVSKGFRKINILWIILTLAVFIYNINFMTKEIFIDNKGKLLLINDLFLYMALGIFIIDVYLRIKDKKSNSYNIINLVIKVYLFLFLLMKVYEIGSLINSMTRVITFLLLSINYFTDLCFFLSLYSITRFIDSQKNNDNTTVKTLIANQSYRCAVIAIICTLINLVLMIFDSIISKNELALFRYTHSLLKNPQTLILIGVFLITFIIRKDYRGKIIKYVVTEKVETTPPNVTEMGKDFIQTDKNTEVNNIENNLTKNLPIETNPNKKPSISVVSYLDNEIKGGNEQ